MFDLAVQWLIVTVDISVKAMVLAAIAMLSLRLLKLDDSNLRHRTWTGVLIGMLLLPVLSQTLPTLQLPVAVPEHWKIYERRDVAPSTATDDSEDAEPIAIGISQQPSSPLATDESSGESGIYRSQWSDDAWSTLPEVGTEAEFGTSSLSLEVTDNIHPTVAELDSDDTEVASITPLLSSSGSAAATLAGEPPCALARSDLAHRGRCDGTTAALWCCVLASSRMVLHCHHFK